MNGAAPRRLNIVNKHIKMPENLKTEATFNARFPHDPRELVVIDIYVTRANGVEDTCLSPASKCRPKPADLEIADMATGWLRHGVGKGALQTAFGDDYEIAEDGCPSYPTTSAGWENAANQMARFAGCDAIPDIIDQPVSAPKDAQEEKSDRHEPAPETSKPRARQKKDKSKAKEAKEAPEPEPAARAGDKQDDGDADNASFGDFRMDVANGLYFTAKARRNNKESGSSETWISAPFDVLARCRDPKGDGWGLSIRWKDADRRDHSLDVTSVAMHGDPGTLAQSLVAGGLNIDREQHRTFQSYLCKVFDRVKKRVTKVDRTGWHDIGGKLIFQLPERTIGDPGGELVRLEAGSQGRYATKGTLDDWKAGVGALSKGHVLPMLAISTALSGSLLHLTEEEGGGINLSALSSMGKTTLLQIAATLWGNGRAKHGFMQTWSASAGGVEIMAALASDTVLILDEIGVADSKSLGSSIYKISSGTGATTMTRARNAAQKRTWRIMTLSSGEILVAAKIAEDPGQKSRAGQSVRMLDIPADRGKGFGVFDRGGSTGDAGDLSNEIKRAATTAYGTAGPAFLRKIIEEGTDKVGQEARAAIDAFVKTYAPAWADGQVKRAARILGLVATAGELATKYGIVPWRKGEATAAAEWALKRWIDSRGGVESGETYRAIAQVRLYIEKQGLPFQRKKDGSSEWVIPQEIWHSEVCKGLNSTFVAKTLCDRKMLLRSKEGFTMVRKVQGHDARAYVVTPKIFDESSEA